MDPVGLWLTCSHIFSPTWLPRGALHSPEREQLLGGGRLELPQHHLRTRQTRPSGPSPHRPLPVFPLPLPSGASAVKCVASAGTEFPVTGGDQAVSWLRSWGRLWTWMVATVPCKPEIFAMCISHVESEGDGAGAFPPPGSLWWKTQHLAPSSPHHGPLLCCPFLGQKRWCPVPFWRFQAYVPP